jgi:hypothetical protein
MSSQTRALAPSTPHTTPTRGTRADTASTESMNIAVADAGVARSAAEAVFGQPARVLPSTPSPNFGGRNDTGFFGSRSLPYSGEILVVGHLGAPPAGTIARSRGPRPLRAR